MPKNKPSIVTLRRASQLPFEILDPKSLTMYSCLKTASRQCRKDFKETLAYCVQHRESEFVTEKTTREGASLFFSMLAQKLKDEQRNVKVYQLTDLVKPKFYNVKVETVPQMSKDFTWIDRMVKSLKKHFSKK